LEPVSQSGPQIASRSSSRDRQRQRNLTKNSSAGSQLCQSDTPIEFAVRSVDLLTRLHRLLFAVDVGLLDQDTPLPIRPFLKLKARKVQTTAEKRLGHARVWRFGPGLRPVSLSSLGRRHCRRAGPRTTARSAWLLPLAASTGSRLQVPRHSSSTHRGWS
jgi:hypothetical protein